MLAVTNKVKVEAASRILDLIGSVQIMSNVNEKVMQGAPRLMMSSCYDTVMFISEVEFLRVRSKLMALMLHLK